MIPTVATPGVTGAALRATTVALIVSEPEAVVLLLAGAGGEYR